MSEEQSTRRWYWALVLSGVCSVSAFLLPPAVVYACTQDVTVWLSGSSAPLPAGESRAFAADGDPDGGSYSWTASSGTIQGSGDSATFTAGGTGQAGVQVKVTYTKGGDSAQASVTFDVVAVTGINPSGGEMIVGEEQIFTPVTTPAGYAGMVWMSATGGLLGSTGPGSITVHACTPPSGLVTATCGTSSVLVQVAIGGGVNCRIGGQCGSGIVLTDLAGNIHLCSYYGDDNPPFLYPRRGNGMGRGYATSAREPVCIS